MVENGSGEVEGGEVFPATGLPKLAFGGKPGAAEAGAVLLLRASESAFAWGTFAVTGA